ncbi:MAG: hypothetical protein R3B82_07540 [Sandaracinaceae bacterium]
MTRLAPLFAALCLASLLTACGGGDPEGEATWETHSTSPDDTAGGEDESE